MAPRTYGSPRAGTASDTSRSSPKTAGLVHGLPGTRWRPATGGASHGTLFHAGFPKTLTLGLAPGDGKWRHHARLQWPCAAQKWERELPLLSGLEIDHLEKRGE